MKRGRHFSVIALLCVIIFLAVCIPLKPAYAKAEGITEGKAECVIEKETGRILYEKRGDVRLPLASTTKILTAITALELCSDMEETVSIPREAVGIEGSSVYLKCNEKYTVKELLYGLMLRSGNDCAVALALYCCGSISAFCSKMNEIAQKAGALSSRFENPHGLPNKKHYTTARDLAYITRYAMQNSMFREIVATEYYSPRNWKNKNKMLAEYDGAIGVKTGYTKEAGRCLVSAAKRENMTLICVVLNCQPMFERSAKLMDDAFKSYQFLPLLTKGTYLPISGGRGEVIKDYYYPVTEGELSQLEVYTSDFSNLQNQKIVGQFRIYLSKRLLFSGNLYKL